MAKAGNLTDSIRQDLDVQRPNSLRLEVINLGYRIGSAQILREVSFTTDGGEVIAIVGQNGAGKSTLMKLLSGDFLPTTGDVLIDGIGATSYAPRQLALKRAVMAQRAAVSFDFTAEEVAMMGRYPHGGSADDAAIIEDVLRHTETLHLRDRFYPTLSGGEAARVTLARVLAQQAPLMLLDEPTAALDLRHQQILMSIVRERASAGDAIIMILHDVNLAAAYADRIIMLRGGGVHAIGTPAEVVTAANIEAVFETPALVLEHPQPPFQACPMIVPLPPPS